MALLLAFIAVALGFSFLCSLLEAVLLSVTPAYLARLSKDDHPAAPRLVRLKGSVDRSLAAILSLNTIAHTVGAAGAGAQAQAIWGSGVLAVTSAVLTLLILVLSEIIPKTLGALYWHRLAPWASRALPIVIAAMYPLVILSELLTNLIRRRRPPPEPLDREEIAAVTEQAAARGLFGESESRILRNLFRFSELRVSDVMTPRIVVHSFSDETPVEALLEDPRAMRFSRVPVWHDDHDDVVGYVLKDEVLLTAARQSLATPLGDLKRDIVVVPAGLSLTRAFEQMLDHREQIALAVDEFGGVSGIVTMEDVVETLLGLEIVDEMDGTADMRELARRHWRARARRLGLV